MALDRNDARPVPYVRGSSQVLSKQLEADRKLLGTSSSSGNDSGDSSPKKSENLNPLGEDTFVTDELGDVEVSINSLSRFVPQVADQEPDQLYRGLIRYNKAPWDPLGDASEGLVVYDGSTWAALGLDFTTDISSLQSQITANDGDISALQSGKADASHTHAYTEVNNITTDRLLGRTTSGTGTAELISVGTGLTLSSGTLSAQDQSKSVVTLRPGSAVLPTSNYATFGSRNNHTVLEFDTSTQESVEYTFALPSNYSGQGLNVKIFFTTDATSGTGGFDVAFDALLGSDIDSSTYDTTVIGTPITVSATAGTVIQQTIALADGDLDGASASEPVRMRLRRDTPNDTAGSDLQVLLIIVELQ